MESSEFVFAGTINTIIGLLIIVGAVVLQIFLSRSQRKWPGLILPVLTFIYSLIGVLSITSAGIRIAPPPIPIPLIIPETKPMTASIIKTSSPQPQALPGQK